MRHEMRRHIHMALRPAACGAALMCAALHIAPRAHAQAVVSSSTVHVGGYYNSNTRLSGDAPVADSSGSADATWMLARRDERLSWSITPRIHHQRYNEQSVLDRTDKYLSVQGRWAAERASVESAVRYVRDNTLTSELGLSGISEVDREHSVLAVNASPSLSISERGTVRLDGAWSRNRYERPQGTGLTDYDYLSVGISNIYALSEVTQLALSFSSGQLRVPGADVETDNLHAQLRLTSAIGEGLNVTLAGGPSRVETELETDSGFNYRAEVQWRGERTSLSTVAGRDVIPTGRGSLSERVHAALAIQYSISERVTTSLRGDWSSNVEVTPLHTIIPVEVQYAGINAMIRWRVLEDWAVWTSAGWTEQRYPVVDSTARGWRGGIGLSWQSRERHW